MDAKAFLADLDAAYDTADVLACGANALLWTKIGQGSVSGVATYRDAFERRRGLIDDARIKIKALIDDGYPDQQVQSISDDIRGAITKRLAAVQAVVDVISIAAPVPAPAPAPTTPDVAPAAPSPTAPAPADVQPAAPAAPASS